MSATIREQAEAMRQRYARVNGIPVEWVSLRYFTANGIEDAECRAVIFESPDRKSPKWTLGTSEGTNG